MAMQGGPPPHRVKPGWVLCDKNGKVNCADLKQWIQDMVDWGERVRADILKLEAHTKHPPGDPGSPPPPPE